MDERLELPVLLKWAVRSCRKKITKTISQLSGSIEEAELLKTELDGLHDQIFDWYLKNPPPKMVSRMDFYSDLICKHIENLKEEKIKRNDDLVIVLENDDQDQDEETDEEEFVVKKRRIRRKPNAQDEDGEEENVVCIGQSLVESSATLNNKFKILRIHCDQYGGHKWNGFTQLTHAIISNIRMHPYLLVRSFLALLFSRSPERELDLDCVRKLFEEIIFMLDSRVRFEPLLELSMFLIRHPELISSEKNFIAKIHNRTQHYSPVRTKTGDIGKQILAIYLEYLDYLEVKNSDGGRMDDVRINKIKNNLRDIIDDTEIESEVNLDIVALLLLELYDYDNELHEAYQVLRNYAERFPDNLHAHVYLYEFMMKYHDLDVNNRQDNIIRKSSLQNIVRLCPDSKYTLRYIQETDDDELEPLKRIELLSNFLDYQANRQSQRAWKIMSQTLSSLSTKHQEICDFFQPRFRCWERMHFKRNELDKDLPDLRLYRIKRRKEESSNSASSSSEYSDIERNIGKDRKRQRLTDDATEPVVKDLTSRRKYQLYMVKARFLETLSSFMELPDSLVKYRDSILEL